MAIAAPLAIIGAVAAVGGTALAIRQQSKAAKKAAKREKVIAQRSRRAAIREAQLKRARAIASAEAVGAGGSSAQAGGIASISSRLGDQLGFQSQVSGLNRSIASAQSKAQLFSGIASLGSFVAGNAGSFAPADAKPAAAPFQFDTTGTP